MDYKHYIVVDEEGFIIDGFSDAFRSPDPGDICINPEGDRQFELIGYVNPSLRKFDRSPRFIYQNGEVKEI